PRWLASPDSSNITDEAGILRVRHTWTREAAHIARHDPARVLREVAALRAILAMAAEQDGYDLPEGVHDGRDPDERERDEDLAAMLGEVVRIHAAVWSDHPDYPGL